MYRGLAAFHLQPFVQHVPTLTPRVAVMCTKRYGVILHRDVEQAHPSARLHIKRRSENFECTSSENSHNP